jgi:hypothetical protein
MSQDKPPRATRLPAPCIIDSGIIVDKRDMQRLLTDLSHVRYFHIQDGSIVGEGEGCVLEVFADSHSATLVANHTLYINVCSFDCLELRQLLDHQACFDLIQDGRQLRLIPLSNPLEPRQQHRQLNAAALEAVVADVLSASWDAQLDEDDAENF